MTICTPTRDNVLSKKMFHFCGRRPGGKDGATRTCFFLNGPSHCAACHKEVRATSFVAVKSTNLIRLSLQQESSSFKVLYLSRCAKRERPRTVSHTLTAPRGGGGVWQQRTFGELLAMCRASFHPDN